MGSFRCPDVSCNSSSCCADVSCNSSSCRGPNVSCNSSSYCPCCRGPDVSCNSSKSRRPDVSCNNSSSFRCSDVSCNSSHCRGPDVSCNSSSCRGPNASSYCGSAGSCSYRAPVSWTSSSGPSCSSSSRCADVSCSTCPSHRRSGYCDSVVVCVPDVCSFSRSHLCGPDLSCSNSSQWGPGGLPRIPGKASEINDVLLAPCSTYGHSGPSSHRTADSFWPCRGYPEHTYCATIKATGSRIPCPAPASLCRGHCSCPCCSRSGCRCGCACRPHTASRIEHPGTFRIYRACRYACGHSLSVSLAARQCSCRRRRPCAATATDSAAAEPEGSQDAKLQTRSAGCRAGRGRTAAAVPGAGRSIQRLVAKVQSKRVATERLIRRRV